METLVKADIFFFITGLAVIVVSVGILVGVFYVINAVRKLEDYARRIESILKEKTEEAQYIVDEVRDIADDIRGSFIYNFLFQRKKRRASKK